MTREDTVKLLSILKAAYPNQFKGMSRTDGEALLSLWAMELEGYPSDLCTEAARKLMRTCKFMPSLSELLDEIKATRIDTQAKMLSDIALGKNVPIEDRQRVLGLLPGESYNPSIVKMIEALPNPEPKREERENPFKDKWKPPELPNKETLDLVRKQAEKRKKKKVGAGGTV